MKIRLADYVADFLAAHGVTDVFSVVGGGAMHLNDALGHHSRLHVTYNHHEQACAMAAEAYARLENRIAAVCVTTGPGGTNALTGVLGGWLDSIPMMIISGQVRYDTTARFAFHATGARVRAMGDQEYDIVRSVTPMTKFAAMVENPADIRMILEKAWHLATTGRPGPVWVDIPVNYQGMYIETDGLAPYDPAADDALLPPPVDNALIQTVLDKIRQAKRPVFHAGYGIRLSGSYAAFRDAVERLNIPVVTYYYRCVVTDSNGKHYSNGVKVERKLPDLVNVVAVADKESAVIGEMVTLTATAEDAVGELSYKWERSTDNTVWFFTGLDSGEATMSFEAHESRLSYYYRCVVTDSTGQHPSNGVKVEISENFVVNEVVYAKKDDTSLTVVKYLGTATEVEIPESINGMTVVEIGEGAFAENETLVTVHLPDTIQYICKQAFKDCTSLANMD